MTEILLADDHPTLMVGLAVLLNHQPDLQVVAQVEDGAEALRQIEALQPHVAVLDCNLPSLGGIEISQALKQAASPVKVLALSAYDHQQYLWSMFKAGAAGYLLKDQAPTQIVQAIRAVARGELLWTVEQRSLIDHWQQHEQNRWDSLTERERAVLRLMATGQRNQAIAATLEVSERTVEYHLTNILGKLHVQSRLEAVVWANKTGLNFF